ncbi:hypothetical protein [Actinomyces viscosus]|uniref:hypothetical protein n=1 Tax=Actinomyces viscosus TaxID=1656 RepID=UPI001432164B|nr:hypothetical protein [Actinomyces viscosus]
MSAGSPEGAGQKSSSPFTSPWFIAAVVFLVVILAAGGWVVGGRVVSGGGRAGRGSPAPSAAPAPAASEGAAGAGGASAGEGASASVCGLAAGDQQVPVQAPVGDITTIAPGVGVPVVDGAGPGIRTGISRCFAHSPTGAVVASANWMKWFSSQQRLPEVITTLMAEGEDRDRLARQVDDGWDGSTTSPVGIKGFKVDVRSSDEVVVTLAVRTGRSSDEGLVSWPVLLRWENGDWKVVAPASNAWGQEPVASVAAGGFTEWNI